MTTPSQILEARAVPSPVMVRVTSPSNLEEGYTFEAVHNDQVFTVTVPPGGVKAGQVFSVPFNPPIEAIAVPVTEAVLSETTPILRAQMQQPPCDQQHPTPSGYWKSGLLECCSEGCFHPSLCMAWCFPKILMGQILTRMKLDFCGNPGQAYRNATCTWIFLTLLYISARSRFTDCALNGATATVSWSVIEDVFDDDDMSNLLNKWAGEVQQWADETEKATHCKTDTTDMLRTINWIWFWLSVGVLAKLRASVRRAYNIPVSCCCEDFLCSAVCGCCTVSQMARQTADYSQQRAYCCTSTGLSESLEV